MVIPLVIYAWFVLLVRLGNLSLRTMSMKSSVPRASQSQFSPLIMKSRLPSFTNSWMMPGKQKQLMPSSPHQPPPLAKKLSMVFRFMLQLWPILFLPGWTMLIWTPTLARSQLCSIWTLMSSSWIATTSTIQISPTSAAKTKQLLMELHPIRIYALIIPNFIRKAPKPASVSEPASILSQASWLENQWFLIWLVRQRLLRRWISRPTLLLRELRITSPSHKLLPKLKGLILRKSSCFSIFVLQ